MCFEKWKRKPPRVQKRNRRLAILVRTDRSEFVPPCRSGNCADEGIQSSTGRLRRSNESAKLALHMRFYSCDWCRDAAELFTQFIHVCLTAVHALSDLTCFLTAQVVIFFPKVFVQLVLLFHLLFHFAPLALLSFTLDD